MTSKAKNGAYEILAAQKSTVTKIAGVITPEAVDNLENEIGGIFTILKSNHFDEGQRYGYPGISTGWSSRTTRGLTKHQITREHTL